MNPDLKVYPSDVYLETESPELRTGMSCKVEIVVAQHEDAIFVPVQAVIRVAGKPTVYVVNEDGSTEERKVEIGLDNNRMVVVESGLSEGEVVWLAPPLKSATVANGSEGVDANGNDMNGAGDTVMRRVNQKLEEANGAKAGRLGQDVGQPGPTEAPSGEQMQQMREQLQNMTPEERQKALQQMRQNMEQGEGARRPGEAGGQGGPDVAVRPQGGPEGGRSRPQGPGGAGGGRSSSRPQRPGGGQ
jgi:hypothetical protein